MRTELGELKGIKAKTAHRLRRYRKKKAAGVRNSFREKTVATLFGTRSKHFPPALIKTETRLSKGKIGTPFSHPTQQKRSKKLRGQNN